MLERQFYPLLKHDAPVHLSAPYIYPCQWLRHIIQKRVFFMMRTRSLIIYFRQWGRPKRRLFHITGHSTLTHKCLDNKLYVFVNYSLHSKILIILSVFFGVQISEKSKMRGSRSILTAEPSRSSTYQEREEVGRRKKSNKSIEENNKWRTSTSSFSTTSRTPTTSTRVRVWAQAWVLERICALEVQRDGRRGVRTDSGSDRDDGGQLRLQI